MPSSLVLSQKVHIARLQKEFKRFNEVANESQIKAAKDYSPTLFSTESFFYLKNFPITGMLFNGRSFLMKYAMNIIRSNVLKAIFTILFSI